MNKSSGHSLVVIFLVLFTIIGVCGVGYFVYRSRSQSKQSDSTNATGTPTKAQNPTCEDKYNEQERNYFIAKGDTKGTTTNYYVDLSCPDRGTLAPAPAP